MQIMTPESDHPPSIILLEKYLTSMRDIRGLASELNVSRDYILAMKWHGFQMPGGKASIRMARAFLEQCSTFKVVTKHHPDSQARKAASSDR